MRKLGLSLLLCGVVSMPVAAWSQGDQPSSAEDYVCAFAGDCEEATEEAPDANTARDPNGPRITATRGFSLSTTPTRPRRPSTTRPRRPTAVQNRTAQSVTPRRPAIASGQRVNLSLAFVSGSARLTPAAEAQARVFGRALLLPQLANMRFRIEGHTDSVGVRARNLTLSQRRAQTVAELLVGMGVPRSRLDVRGYGPDRPLPGTRGDSGQNRRVEAVRIS